MSLVPRLYMTLPAFAANCGRLQETSIDSWYAAPAPAVIDRYLLPAQQQTSRTPLLLSIDGTGRRTDGRTLDRYIHCSAYNGGSINKRAACVCVPVVSYLHC